MSATYEQVVAETYQPLNAAATILDFTPEEIAALYDAMGVEEQAEFEKLVRNSPPKALMPHQIVPDPFAKDRWWEVFLGIGGRGTAKTTTGSFGVREHLRQFGRKARVGVGAPTTADARDVCAEGETGLITMFPNEFTKYNRSLGEARHIGGGLVKFMGTEKPKRWNGPQWSMVWFDEVALCVQEAWNDAMLGLRIKGPNGEHPYAMGTTTPKNRKWVKALAMEKTTYVPQYIDAETKKRRLPTTFDNPYLPERRVEWLKNKFLGSRIGRQELLGEFVDDVAGAKFKRDWFIYETNPNKWPRMVRVIVAVDPAGSAARKEADKNSLTEDQKQNLQKNADTGLAVVGLGTDGKFYVMALQSGQWTPNEWGAEAIRLYHLFRADKIVAESNYGGLMVESNLRNVDVYDTVLKRQLTGRHLPIKLVTASRGKHIRAEPVTTLYEQGKITHCRYFGPAEDQMCAFIDADDNEGADMVDALVWAVSELMGISDFVGQTLTIVPGDERISSFRVVR